MIRVALVPISRRSICTRLPSACGRVARNLEGVSRGVSEVCRRYLGGTCISSEVSLERTSEEVTRKRLAAVHEGARRLIEASLARVEPLPHGQKVEAHRLAHRTHLVGSGGRVR